MRSIIRVSKLIGAVLIVTVALAVHKPEIAFAQPTPLCPQICVDLSTESIQDLRDECDARAQDKGYSVGILRPKNVHDTILVACAVSCGFLDTWICLGI